MTARRVWYAWESREGPPCTMQDEEKQLERMERRRDGMKSKFSHEIDSLQAYALRRQNEDGFTVRDQIRIDKAIVEIERLRQAMEDRYAEFIPRQRFAVQRRRASLVAFGMLGLQAYALHPLNLAHELIDVILRLASE